MSTLICAAFQYDCTDFENKVSERKLKSMSMFVQAISKIACIISFYEWYTIGKWRRIQKSEDVCPSCFTCCNIISKFERHCLAIVSNNQKIIR